MGTEGGQSTSIKLTRQRASGSSPVPCRHITAGLGDPARAAHIGAMDSPSSSVPVCSFGARAGLVTMLPCRDAGEPAGPSPSLARLLTSPFPPPLAASLSGGTALCPQTCSSPLRALFSFSSLLIWECILRMTWRRCAFPSMVPHPAARPPAPLAKCLPCREAPKPAAGGPCP